MGSGFRTFQSGEVLTSSNVQNYLMDQSVMVFAGTAARSSAIASPETGMVSYRTDGTADSKREGFEFYDGSNWTRLVPAASVSGLTLISNTAHSAASSVSVDNVFSSTYTNYRIIWQSSFSTSLTPTMRFRAGGTATTSSYAFQFVIGSSTTITANRGTAQANLDIFGGASAGPLLAIYDIYGPNLAANTAGSGIVNMLYGGNLVHHNYSIAQQGTTQFDGVEINASTGNMTGNLWIYGYRKDV